MSKFKFGTTQKYQKDYFQSYKNVTKCALLFRSVNSLAQSPKFSRLFQRQNLSIVNDFFSIF